MKLDFHTHGKLAKRLPFSTQYTDWLFGEAKAAGLDAPVPDRAFQYAAIR